MVFSKQVCLFQLFRYVFETPKQTQKFFCFTKQTEKQPKLDVFRFKPKIFFVCFKDTLVEPRAVDPLCFDADLEPDPDPA
jgi:hypothetical protein